MMALSRSKFTVYEEYEADDESNNNSRNLPLIRSYDLIANSTGSNPEHLKNSAKIRRIKATCHIYNSILKYAQRSSGGVNVTVQQIYKIDRHCERKPFDDKYRILLWHGTSPQSVSGIISTGFRKGSGGLFGGGIYFADRLAKSLAYTGKTASGQGFLFIAEVAPGRVYKAHHIHSNYQTAPAGFDCVKGNGTQIPTWKQNENYHGAILPCGETRTNPRFSQYDLGYNEYIIYDPSRIIIRFLVECIW